jgi:hypothetical protein
MTKPIETNAKLIIVKNDNPFREGTAVHKRARAVLTSTTVAQALKKGARTSTVRYLVGKRQVKVVVDKKSTTSVAA